MLPRFIGVNLHICLAADTHVSIMDFCFRQGTKWDEPRQIYLTCYFCSTKASICLSDILNMSILNVFRPVFNSFDFTCPLTFVVQVGKCPIYALKNYPNPLTLGLNKVPFKY